MKYSYGTTLAIASTPLDDTRDADYAQNFSKRMLLPATLHQPLPLPRGSVEKGWGTIRSVAGPELKALPPADREYEVGPHRTSFHDSVAHYGTARGAGKS